MITKSSSNLLRADQAQKASAWQPVDFSLPAVEDNEVKVEEILALFNRLTAAPAGKEIPAGGLTQAGMAPDVQVWEPEDLHWIPPFETSSWDSWDHSTEEDVEETAQEQFSYAGITPVNEAQLQEEMLAILSKARLQADEIIIQAQQAADETLQMAQDEASQAQGEGYRAGWEKAMTEAASVLAAGQAVVREISEWRNAMLEQSETHVIGMVKEIARIMFGDGLKLEPALLQQNLSRALENAKSLGDLKLYLHPFDAEKIDQAWRENQRLITGHAVQIIPSDGIKPGGCYIQGQMGTVDARIETELNALLGVFDAKDENPESNA
ncbi:MAG: hypothetical protein HY835_11470 [Anaerolineae bacterium]|nr:hypothetical protein [Anaerolineae bacterium]